MLALSLVLLRVYTRGILVRNSGIDDGCVIITLVSAQVDTDGPVFSSNRFSC